MGLTIHYQFAVGEKTAREVRRVLEELRKFAETVGFLRVSGMVVLEGEGCEVREEGDEHAWLKVQAIRWLTREEGDTTYAEGEIVPTCLVAFSVTPAEGSEQANFGLCRYPDKEGWFWSSACKTQYASNPSSGDVENFLKCHVGLVRVLDKAKALGILEKVVDEGKYWEERDAEKLGREVGRWNRMVAGFYGKMRDAAEAKGGEAGDVQGAIARFSNFERLEAEGREGE